MNLTSAHKIRRWDRNSPLRTDSKQKGLEHDLILGRSPTSIEIATNQEGENANRILLAVARELTR